MFCFRMINGRSPLVSIGDLGVCLVLEGSSGEGRLARVSSACVLCELITEVDGTPELCKVLVAPAGRGAGGFEEIFALPLPDACAVATTELELAAEDAEG